MKRIILPMLLILMVIPGWITAQEKEKEIRVKMVKIVDGEKIVTDTTFVTTGDAQETVDLLLEQEVNIDSTGQKVIRVNVESEGDAGEEKTYAVTVISGDDGESHIMVHPPKEPHRVMKWTDEEGGEQVFEFRLQKEEMEAMEDEIRQQVKVIMEQKGDLEEQMRQLEIELPDVLGELPPPPPPAGFDGQHRMVMHKHAKPGGPVQEKELRDAGIKNQPDLLKLNNFNINNDNGVITLDVVPENKKDALKVIVYNYFGDKVYSGKLEQSGDAWSVTIDLSGKQPGTYYLQLVQKTASVTERVRL